MIFDCFTFCVLRSKYRALSIALETLNIFYRLQGEIFKFKVQCHKPPGWLKTEERVGLCGAQTKDFNLERNLFHARTKEL